MSWWSLDHDRITAETSDVESRRFGRSVARVVVGAQTPQDRTQFRAALTRHEDVAIVRYPSINAWCPAVVAAAGRDVLAADSLTYWWAPAEVMADSAAPDETTPEVVRPDQVDPAKLAGAIAAAFNGYVNHYSANPLFDRAAANAGYVEWVTGALAADPRDGVVLVTDGEVDGWGMWGSDPGGGDFEWMMAGVSPRSRGRALYTVLMARACQEAVERGKDRVLLSTQGSNVGIQRVWARAGALPFADFTTLHLVKRGLLSA